MAGTAGQVPAATKQQDVSQMKAAAVELTINGYTTWALVDSGADTSMINNVFAHRVLEKQSFRSKPLPCMTGAGGEPLAVLSQAMVPFRIQTAQFLEPMLAVQGLVYQVVLGRDFCCKHGTVLDDDAGVLRLKKIEIQLPTYAEIRPKRSRVTTCSALVIPPRSESMVNVAVEALDGGINCEKGKPWEGVLEPTATKRAQEWLVPRTVASVCENGTMPLKVVNVSTKEVTVPDKTEIGTFFTIQDDGDGLYEVFDYSDAVPSGSSPVAKDIITLLNVDDAALSEEGKQTLKELVTNYSDIFSKDDSDIGRTSVLKHNIETGDAQPIKQRPRRVPLKLREEVERQKEKMLKDGIIEESSSPWCSPIVLAKKKDGSFRFCVDLRAVNSVTQSLPHPLPRVDDTLDSLAGARYFSTLDMASGYWQVELAEGDKEKTAFTTGRGLHQFRTMAFGLKNAGPTFQRLMELVLAGIDAKNCLVYIDDIIVFGSTEENHLKTLKEVFQKIREAGMKLKPRKCSLAKAEVVFLGHKVGRDGVQPDPANVQKVRDWPITDRPEELKSFLGLCGYYARFVPGYSDLVKPLRDAADSKHPISWSEEMRGSFEELKSRLTSQPILSLPSMEGEFTLATDASNTAIGSVLTQIVDGQERVIAYASKVLSKTERRWPTYDKELWAVVWSIRHFRQYLVGASFTVLSDHKPLQNVPQSIVVENDATGRRGRWAVEMSSYDFRVRYRKGVENGNADAMSRCSASQLLEEEETSTEKEEKAALEACLAANLENQGIEMGRMAMEQEHDPLLGEVRCWMFSGRPPTKKQCKKLNRQLRPLARCFDQLVITDGVLGVKRNHNGTEAVRILLPRVYRSIILKMLHDDPLSGHLGHARTRDKVLDRFYWPSAEKDIREYCDSCVECQRRRLPTPHMQATLRTEVQSRPYERIAIDITEMPLSSKGNKYALVVMDYFSKYVHVFPMPNQTTETVVNCLMKLILEQGVPERLHSDQGRQFEASVFQELCKRLGILKTRTTPYHPQSDGMVERFNRTLKDMVAKYVQSDGSDWDEVAGPVAFAYNTSKHAATGYTPFFLVHGREARLPVDSLVERVQEVSSVNSFVENRLRHLYRAFENTRRNQTEAAKRMVQRGDHSQREITYHPGDKVWINDPTANAGGKRKLGMPYSGPGMVVRALDDEERPVVYKIRMANGKEVNIHHNRLKPVVERMDEIKEPAVTRKPTQGTQDDKLLDVSSKEPVCHKLRGSNYSVGDLVSFLEENGLEGEAATKPYTTRSGRTVKPVDRYQGGIPQ